MDYFSDRLSSISGRALSGINKLRQERHQQRRRQQETQLEPIDQNDTSARKQPATGTMTATAINRTSGGQLEHRATSLAAGFAFGGDTNSCTTFGTRQQKSSASPVPPIGFRTDLLEQSSSPTGAIQQQPANYATIRQPADRQLSASEESLYSGDAWTRMWFQRVLLLSLIRLMVFVRKVYEDFQATKTYNSSGHIGHLIAAAAALFLPTIVFTIYRVSRYLQVELPQLRPPPLSPASNNSDQVRSQKRNSRHDHADDQSGQLRRALMSSSPTGGELQEQQTAAASTGSANEDDGLVTARQSPTNTDEQFHDSKSQQPDSGSRQQVNKVETFDVDKLGNLPDKETTRVVIGASEQILHGALYVFWQLKRQVDVLGYLVERACLWRKPSTRELAELDKLRTGSDGLEWFQDFYAAFLAILAQVYTLGVHWSGKGNEPGKQTGNFLVQGGGSSPFGADPVGDSNANEISISNAARAISNTLSAQVAAGDSKDLLIISELVVSTAVVFSLLIAVRRLDDGPLTLGLSMLGWGSLFFARIIIIALAYVHIGWIIMSSLLLCHVCGITIWIYKIAIDSHNDRPSELQLEAMWRQEDDENRAKSEAANEEAGQTERNTKPEATIDKHMPTHTSTWSIMEHLVLITQIVALFSVPSIFYWPIMFNLKFHLRPFKYLVLILTQNFLLIPAIYYLLSQSASTTPGQLYLLGAVGALSIIGFVFVSLYICCKPTLTEYFARADELFNEADQSGIYYEFCSRVFKMPDLGQHAFKRLMNQTEEIMVDNEDEERGPAR